MSLEIDEYIPRPRYAKIGDNIIILDHIHGVILVKADSKEFPYQVIVTYRYPDGSKEVGVLQVTSKEEGINDCRKISEQLGVR